MQHGALLKTLSNSKAGKPRSSAPPPARIHPSPPRSPHSLRGRRTPAGAGEAAWEGSEESSRNPSALLACLQETQDERSQSFPHLARRPGSSSVSAAGGVRACVCTHWITSPILKPFMAPHAHSLVTGCSVTAAPPRPPSAAAMTKLPETGGNGEKGGRRQQWKRCRG